LSKPAGSRIFIHEQTTKGHLRVADGPKNHESGISGGDSQQWRRLLEEVTPKLYQMFIQRFPNPSLAEELTQKTVFDAIRGRHTYDASRGTPQEWIFGIAFNNIRLELRRRASQPVMSGELSILLAAMDTRLLPDEVLERKELAGWVRGAIDCLPEREAEVLKARYLDELSIAEVATRMEVTEKAVYSLLYRAGISFRQKLQSMTQQAEYGDEHAEQRHT
jgi:RNA polymerase sigma-70 factor, ECF subfamily